MVVFSQKENGKTYADNAVKYQKKVNQRCHSCPPYTARRTVPPKMFVFFKGNQTVVKIIISQYM